MREAAPRCLDSHQLKAAREAATARFLGIAAAIKAEASVKEHVIRKSLSGLAYVPTGKIIAPEGRTRKQLFILVHECAHVALHRDRRKSRHVEELHPCRILEDHLQHANGAVAEALDYPYGDLPSWTLVDSPRSSRGVFPTGRPPLQLLIHIEQLLSSSLHRCT